MAQPHGNSINEILGGRYKIEQWIAQGGMSSVYRASDPNLGRTVAVKLIHPHLSGDPDFVQRFKREAAAVAQLRHPNIVQVYDFNHDGDLYYMVLEFVQGETLQSQLKKLNAANKRLSLSESARIMAAICDAVAYAHQRSMIHRDIKPANVILNYQGEPILMDFGVAKMLGETQHTMTGAVIGTALYMSPEQARGEHPDERTDIYSLGVVLFEMITGRPPFDGDSAVAIMMKHVNEPVPDIREVSGDIPDELVAIVEKALAKDPADRYQTATEMATALRATSVYAWGVSRPAAPRAARPAPSASAVRAGQPAASAVRPAQPADERSWLPWVVSAATVLALILILGAALLFVAWRFVRPVLLAGQVNLPSAEGMVKVGGGVYLVGLDKQGDGYILPHQVQLNEFWIDRYEVMNMQYAEFLADSGQAPPVSWPAGKLPAGHETHPVVGVSWDQAAAYCQWANKRLPTEAEWEVVARGPQGLLYPWGNDEKAVVLPTSGTYPVGSISSDQSPFGAHDMAGNVWEWVGDTYAPVPQGQRVLRGGGAGFLKDMAYRLHGDPNIPTMVASAGIRCAADKVQGGAAPVEMMAVAALPAGVLFQDEFVDPQSGWPVGQEETRRFGYHPAAFYHLEVSRPNDSLAVFRGLNFGDFTGKVQALVDHTDTQSGDFRYGLAIRRAGDDYYAFIVSPRHGTWQALKHSSGGWEVLAEGMDDSIRGLTAADTLRVDAAGSDFTYSINDRQVAQVSDADYASGDVGFVLETFDESLVHVHYAALTIEELSAGQVGVLSEDEFSDPNSGWPTLDVDGYRYGYHPPDFYHVEVKAPHQITTVFREPSVDDASVETRVVVDHTESQAGDFRYGLAVRALQDRYYAFMVSPRGATWQVSKHSASGVNVLAEGTDDSLRGMTAADTLRVEAAGPDLTFYINDRQVAQVNDSDYASGDVGFVVETLDESLAHIHYDALMIRDIQ